MALTPQDRQLITEGQKALTWARKNAGIVAIPYTTPTPSPTPKKQEEPKPEYPNRIVIDPHFSIVAIQEGQGNAARFIDFANQLDKDGAGRVGKKYFRKVTRYYGLSERERQRWISEAWQHKYIRGEDPEYYYLTSRDELKARLGMDFDTLLVEVSAFDLVKPKRKYRACVYIAMRSLFKGKPASQKIIREMTGAPERTQRHWLAGRPKEVKRSKNYAQTKHRADMASGVRENGIGDRDYPNAFAGGDGRVWLRMPDQYDIPHFVAKPLDRVRTSRRVSKLSTKTGNYRSFILREKGDIMRLFYDDIDKFKGAARKVGREIQELFLVGKNYGHCKTWACVPVSDIG